MEWSLKEKGMLQFETFNTCYIYNANPQLSLGPPLRHLKDKTNRTQIDASIILPQTYASTSS